MKPSRMTLTIALAICAQGGLAAAEPTIGWTQCLRQPAGWYPGAEAGRVAEVVIRHQRTSGGWPKNEEMARELTEADRAHLAAARSRTDSTIDNGATTTQMRFLARVYRAQPGEVVGAALVRGFDFLLDAQYSNGGWPQNWPQPRGYAAHITSNDNAMVSVLALLRDAVQPGGDFAFLDEHRRARAQAALTQGVECILRCQVLVRGRRTAWCAQHDETTRFRLAEIEPERRTGYAWYTDAPAKLLREDLPRWRLRTGHPMGSSATSGR